MLSNLTLKSRIYAQFWLDAFCIIFIKVATPDIVLEESQYLGRNMKERRSRRDGNWIVVIRYLMTT
jgi:hypothetical protein